MKLSVWAFLLLFPFIDIKASEVVVHNQEDYDMLKRQILTALTRGEKEIDILFTPGIYYFKDNDFVISRIKAENTKIRFVGNGATLIPEGHRYYSGDTYEGDFSYDNSWMAGATDVSVWTQMRYADELIEVLDDRSKMCRLKCSEMRSFVVESGFAYVNITHWYKSSIYRIEKIEGDYLFFTAPDLNQSALIKNGVNLNDDFYFFKTLPRFRLCNVETGENLLRIKDGKLILPSGCNEVYEGKATRLYSIYNSELSEFVITGFTFLGNSYQDATSYIYFNDLKANSVKVKDCRFIGLHGNPISIIKTDNVTVEGNTFSDCYFGGVLSDNYSANTRIVNNVLERMGKRRQDTFTVTCRGTDYYICDNTFTNYGYGGISVGDWYRASHEQPSRGVVENNKLTFSEDYLKEIELDGIMDGGAIYLQTKNDGAILRNNIINGFSGAGGNKGIFCDDGAYGFSLIGNVVTSVKNSYCITSRRVTIVEDSHTPGTGIEASNINNIIKDNIVDGKVMFAGHERTDNGCVLGDNYVLIYTGEDMPEISISNVAVEGQFIPIEHTGTKRGKIGVSRKSYKLLKKSPEWKRLKGQFIRK